MEKEEEAKGEKKSTSEKSMGEVGVKNAVNERVSVQATLGQTKSGNPSLFWSIIQFIYLTPLAFTHLILSSSLDDIRASINYQISELKENRDCRSTTFIRR